MFTTGLTLCLAVLDVLEWGKANTSSRPQTTFINTAPAK